MRKIIFLCIWHYFYGFNNLYSNLIFCNVRVFYNFMHNNLYLFNGHTVCKIICAPYMRFKFFGEFIQTRKEFKFSKKLLKLKKR